MRRYIIMTYDIHTLGGCQNYLSGKCPFLVSKGWEVYVLFAGLYNGKCEFGVLSSYSNGNIQELDFIPAEFCKRRINIILEKLSKVVTSSDQPYEESIIESHFDKMHLWGELLAERIGAKHVCFNCNELFRGADKYYEAYIDFFRFKFGRKELYGIAKDSLVRLFGDDTDSSLKDNRLFMAKIPDSVQDVECDALESIQESDWNICYIGRLLKQYVDNILVNVASFSKLHSTKTINFIIVGDAAPKLKRIKELFDQLPNVHVFLLGNLVPIPRALVRKMDVIIAGAGCALSVVNENIPVIVPDSEVPLSNGLLGYENESPIILDDGRERETFCQSLQRVLVEKVHIGLSRRIEYPSVPMATRYNEHMSMIAESSPIKDYYPSSVLMSGRIPFVRKVSVVLRLAHRRFARALNKCRYE